MGKKRRNCCAGQLSHIDDSLGKMQKNLFLHFLGECVLVEYGYVSSIIAFLSRLLLCLAWVGGPHQ